MTKIHIDLAERGYDINIGCGLIDRAGELFDLNRRVLIVTDAGVPREYSERVLAACREGEIITVGEGEGSKSIECFTRLCERLIEMNITRSDCLVAVGGGVVGDLTGFVAASYMRGIDFYNIPTTLLSQVDSSIGGKTAINLGGIKNVVGAFYQPKGVIVDPLLLRSLPRRHLLNGLAESIKMSLTSDEELFRLIERSNIDENIEEIIIRSLKIKQAVVEADEREGGIRRILNFGHSLGHAIESQENMGGLYHGECVAIGMTSVCSDSVRSRLIPLLKRVGLPYCYDGNLEEALKYVLHDKKCEGEKISVVFVDRIGEYRIVKMDTEAFCALVHEELRK